MIAYAYETIQPVYNEWNILSKVKYYKIEQKTQYSRANHKSYSKNYWLEVVCTEISCCISDFDFDIYNPALIL